MIDNIRLIKSIVKLIELTNENKILWNSVLQQSDLKYSVYAEQYESQYIDHRLVFEYNPVPLAHAGLGPALDHFSYSLSVYAADGTLEVNYRNLSALSGLYASVRRQMTVAAEPFLAAIEAA